MAPKGVGYGALHIGEDTFKLPLRQVRVTCVKQRAALVALTAQSHSLASCLNDRRLQEATPCAQEGAGFRLSVRTRGNRCG